MLHILRGDVTADDIRDGKQMECGGCPVARAVTRAAQAAGIWRDGAMVAVTYEKARIYPPDGASPRALAADLDLRLVSWISRFDCGDHVEPTSFRLELRPVDLQACDRELLAALTVAAGQADAATA
jgi:hypothetical protein